jgi:glutaminase
VLPLDTDVQALITAGYGRYRDLGEGAVADYIPALAAASPTAFGVCIAGVHGRLFSIGDADQEFAIESISKLFVFALVCHTLGQEEARRKLGVNSTGLPFNSVMAIELNAERTMKPPGQCRCHGHHKPGAGYHCRREIREHHRCDVAVRRAAAGDGRGRL